MDAGALVGQIKSEVNSGILFGHPDHRALLTPFLNGFDVTWGRSLREHNTDLHVYFLLPEQHFKESYGFENEVLLVYSPYERLELRTFQAIEKILHSSPAKGRVETLSYFLVTDVRNIEEAMESYVDSRQDSRIVIPFFKNDLLNAKLRGDDWFIRNRLNKHFFGRDLFNYTLPLVDDAYFFGRQNLLMSYLDSIRQCENRAIFGLRKTGKTSFLYKLGRTCSKEKIANVFYFDCKVPHVRKSRWNELLLDIANEIAEKIKIKLSGDFSERTASRDFEYVIKEAQNQKIKILLMLDEIEYISFVSPVDKHWNEDYIDFWQTMWSCQSRYKCISFIIAGVNPTIVEKDSINGIQNPLFGIVPHQYLTGLCSEEVKIMIKKLGKRMGLKFESDTCCKIHNWYGGHPLLTRQACSNLNTFLNGKNEKPIQVDGKKFNEHKGQIDRELVFYSDHVISEIRQFYPEEYRLLELLSIGEELEFRKKSQESPEIKHLKGYQLIKEDGKNHIINIPVVAKRIALESQRLEGRELIYPIVEKNQREPWLKGRIEQICSEMRVLEKLIEKHKKPFLFGPNSFPEAEQLSNINVADTAENFSFFINALNRSFVESIERYGKSKSDSKYFWGTIQKEYIFLWPTLDRIKVYRNERDHLHLNDQASTKLFSFLEEDLEKRDFSQLDGAYFVIQQRILDRFLLATLREMDQFY
ncbi:hypothetical protein ACUN8C_00855 [Kushneria sp. Sum13]|uniref:hypothetical protein n=1 Tax=Kushneria sp. Sum13 TaxID=3459196 RepID=UPI0040452536